MTLTDLAPTTIPTPDPADGPAGPWVIDADDRCGASCERQMCTPASARSRDCASASGSLVVTGVVNAGAVVEVAGTAPWAAKSRVSYFVCAEPRLLARTIAGDDGLAMTELTIPTGLDRGVHRLVGIGLSPQGEVLVQVASLEIG